MTLNNKVKSVINQMKKNNILLEIDHQHLF